MSEGSEDHPILEMRHITKRFPGVLALDDVDFSVRRGEIHSLIGQNGAGKSTLMKILAGDYQPTAGEIVIDGQPVSFGNQREARARGIAIVYQELSLLPNLSVADNISLGKEAGGFVIDQAAVEQEAQKTLDQLGISVDVNQRLGRLPLAQQQLVEIAKALSFKPQILILDEPTAALAPRDAEHLFEILARLKRQDIAIIFISHRLKEILMHCDRGTILRNGRVVKVQEIDETTTEEDLIEPMIGQHVEDFYRHRAEGQADVQRDLLIEVENLTIGDQVRGVSFELKRGEILGITGLLGAGQNELARALFGNLPYEATLRRNGQAVRIDSPQQAIAHGICLLTENRKEEGLFLDMTVKENITMPSLQRFKRGLSPFVSNHKEQRAAADFIDRVNVILSSADARVRTLSGGNQQKAILARWLLRDLEVLIFIEPTRGIDVGAKAEIYRYLDTLAKEGRGIIVISPELIEILGIADRILVMREGQLVREFTQQEATEEGLLAAIQGATLRNHRHNEGANGNGDYTTTASISNALD